MADLQQRELHYRKRKLLHDAAEMQERLGCEVAVILFAPNGDLVQFSTTSMTRMLTAYARACREPHEIYIPAEKIARRDQVEERRPVEALKTEPRVMLAEVAESFEQLDAMFARLIAEQRTRVPKLLCSSEAEKGTVAPDEVQAAGHASVGDASLSGGHEELRSKGERLDSASCLEAIGGTLTPRASGSPAVGSLETPVVADLPRRVASLSRAR